MVARFDVIVVGAGPAGSVCATVCARQGLKVLLIEREKFPRDKVCGDCLNPSAWAVLERLGIEGKIRALPQASFRKVEIATIGGRVFHFDLPVHERGEVGIRRRDLDQALLENAAAAGVEIVEDSPVTAVREKWEIVAGGSTFSASTLVAADGRNSTICRLLGLLPAQQKDRVGIQTHLPLSPGQEGTVRMQFHPEGYSGGAAIGGNLWNLCLVARGNQIASLKARATRLWDLPSDLAWRSLTPLSRAALPSVGPGLFLVGDAVRVVEPFTGEGIYYALASGELAGRHLREPALYAKKHAALYHGRLWINQLTKWAVLHPQTTSWLLENLPLETFLRHLTTKITGPKTAPSSNLARQQVSPREFPSSRPFHDAHAPHAAARFPPPSDARRP